MDEVVGETPIEAFKQGSGIPGPMNRSPKDKELEMGDTEATKICSVCKRALPLDDFAKKKDGAQGRQPYCRTCSTAKRREYERRRAMKEMGIEEEKTGYVNAKDADVKGGTEATGRQEPSENGRPIVLTVTIPAKYRDLYVKLEGMAEKEFRSPENQLLWILKEA